MLKRDDDSLFVAAERGRRSPMLRSFFLTVLAFPLTASAQRVAATLPVGSGPAALAVNALTNKIYVANSNSSTVTVIDGATNHSSTVAVGTHPYAVAVNSRTIKVYVADFDSDNMTVIDGLTNQTATVRSAHFPDAVAVNAVTNKIYEAAKHETVFNMKPFS